MSTSFTFKWPLLYPETYREDILHTHIQGVNTAHTHTHTHIHTRIQGVHTAHTHTYREYILHTHIHTGSTYCTHTHIRTRSTYCTHTYTQGVHTAECVFTRDDLPSTNKKKYF